MTRLLKSYFFSTMLVSIALLGGGYAIAQVTPPTPAANEVPAIVGYADGRSDAPYGVYESKFAKNAQELQIRLLELEKKVFATQSLDLTSDPVKTAQDIYRLEAECFDLNLQIANAKKISSFERKSLLLGTSRVYSNIRFFAERQYEDMIRKVDVKFPGPSGVQLRMDIKGQSFYQPNYRIDSNLTAKQRQKLYDEKVKLYYEKHLKFPSFESLSIEWLSTRGPFTRVEYVEMQDGEIHVTEGDAGHVLLAQGGRVKSAGQMIFLRGKSGKFSMAVVSNSSGNYKPDILSAALVSETVADLTGLDSRMVVLTKGEPLSSQSLRLYSKILELDKDDTNKIVDDLKSLMQDLQQTDDDRLVLKPLCENILIEI